MAKIKWSTTQKLTGAGTFIVGGLIGHLTKIESLLSLIFMIENPNISAFLEVAIPIIIGVLFWCSYWLYLKIMNWKKKLMERVSELEENIKEISANERRIKQIENNLLIQDSINRQNDDFIAEAKGKTIKELNLIYDNKHKKFIAERGEHIKRGQEGAVLQKYRQSLDQFHDPAKL